MIECTHNCIAHVDTLPNITLRINAYECRSRVQPKYMKRKGKVQWRDCAEVD